MDTGCSLEDLLEAMDDRKLGKSVLAARHDNGDMVSSFSIQNKF